MTKTMRPMTLVRGLHRSPNRYSIVLLATDNQMLALARMRVSSPKLVACRHTESAAMDVQLMLSLGVYAQRRVHDRVYREEDGECTFAPSLLAATGHGVDEDNESLHEWEIASVSDRQIQLIISYLMSANMLREKPPSQSDDEG